jgi:hypothetical protein
VGNSFDQPKENMNFALKNTHGVCQPLQTEQQIKVRTVSAAPSHLSAKMIAATTNNSWSFVWSFAPFTCHQGAS